VPSTRENVHQYPHVGQLFIISFPAKLDFPRAVKSGYICTTDYQQLFGTAVQPMLALALHDDENYCINMQN